MAKPDIYLIGMALLRTAERIWRAVMTIGLCFL
jgi:hypothetical protein